MESKIIRQKFLSFFEQKQHKIVPSAPIVVQNDPTLMFTNAGMNQFKDYFLGNKKVVVPRIADTQKCLRVSGKHNDLEEVGFDTYHHTMFEMLGNWSFGDYFKKDAINWAWELLTEVYKLPIDRLYASVFEGDVAENLEADEEARAIWSQYLPVDRILNGSKKDNFWEMGDTGPCGPCSEIHIDLRSEAERQLIPGRDLVNNDHPQVVEIWNLVFIQFNRLANGSLENLPDKHVDTGMGFERLAMAIQGKQSNYDTDVFQPVIQLVATKAGVLYGANEKTDIAIRVIADHIRAISFTIADGQLPGNVKAGYVIRRILRRAVRYGYTFLNFHEPFLCDLVPLLASQFEETFPELKSQQEFVMKVIREEEAAFLRTLEKGLKRFEGLKGEAVDGKISGKSAFELYDTYGFPADLTALIAKENNLSIDQAGFDAEMKAQKDRSRAASQQETGDWKIVHDDDEHSVFIGYDNVSSQSRIMRYRAVSQKGKNQYQLIMDKTPFYAESGGQIGDTGWLVAGEEKIEITDTKKENDLIVHFSSHLPKKLDGFFEATIHEGKRRLTENNHSATHLLHAALREVLGSHVQQRGSLVNEQILRFDFSHFSKMTDAEIDQVEEIVNFRIAQNIPLEERRNVPIAEAKKLGAMALFGEKYGEFVRVITFDSAFSVELCGGTHVPATGVIKRFKIMSEGSVAAGVRRIEAITASKAESYLKSRLQLLTEIESILKNPADPIKAIQALMLEKNEQAKIIDQLLSEKAKDLKQVILTNRSKIGEIDLLTYSGVFPNAEGLKQLSFEFKNEFPQVIFMAAVEIDQKPFLSIMISDSLVSTLGLNAAFIVREMATLIQGGGGGQPFYATAGGKDRAGLDTALSKGITVLKEKVSAVNN